MEQTIVTDFPPIYNEIAAVFRIHERRDVVFSFGSKLYNPYALVLPGQIIAHEAVHGERQGEDGNGILSWWKRYMEDKGFRFVEELHAHRAEYRWLMENGNRKQRRSALKEVAGRLASPMYGRMVDVREAKQLLRILAEDS